MINLMLNCRYESKFIIDDENGNPIKVVIYKSNHDGKIWVRPYDNFASKVDKEKYPSAEQEYRFEQID